MILERLNQHDLECIEVERKDDVIVLALLKRIEELEHVKVLYEKWSELLERRVDELRADSLDIEELKAELSENGYNIIHVQEAGYA